MSIRYTSWRSLSNPVATNHQGAVEWTAYAAAVDSVEREQHLRQLLGAEDAGETDPVGPFLRPPP